MKNKKKEVKEVHRELAKKPHKRYLSQVSKQHINMNTGNWNLGTAVVRVHLLMVSTCKNLDLVEWSSSVTRTSRICVIQLSYKHSNNLKTFMWATFNQPHSYLSCPYLPAHSSLIPSPTMLVQLLRSHAAVRGGNDPGEKEPGSTPLNQLDHFPRQ